jgi:ATP-binding cassette subfamily B protein
MSESTLLKGYLADQTLSDESGIEPPSLEFRKMLRLALRTWPFMRPMLKHLIFMAVSIGIFGLIAAFLGTIGYDMFTNKMLVGQKLQSVQATMLFLGDEYVSTDPLEGSKTIITKSGGKTTSKKGGAASKGIVAGKGGKGAKGAALPDLVPELTPAQRKIVRNRLIIWSIIGGILSALGISAWYYYSTWVWQSINQSLRVAMVDRAETLSLRFHANSRVGDAIFRVYQDSAQIINLLQAGLITPLMIIYGVLVGIVFVFAFDPWFALMVVIVAIPVGWVIAASTSRIRRRSLENRMANSDLTSRVQEVFSAIKIVKANRAEARIFDRFNEDSNRALDAAYFLRLDMVIMTAIIAMLGGAMLVLSEYVMVMWVIENRETYLGALVVSFVGFAVWNLGAMQYARARVGGLNGSAQGLLGVWMRMQDLFIALDRAFYLLDLEPEIVDPDNPVAFPSPIQRVSWSNVAFRYSDDQDVLKGIDLAADAGSVTAIVGATGSGKSTLMSLLLRLYDPDTGEVAVNGVDLRDMAVDGIRVNTAIALQKNVLFAKTVADNIAFGTLNADRAMIEAAAGIACADEFIKEMPKGYDTELGERGGKLSSGERQRLSIARAIVRDTPILILDEPTASLDARTEQKVMANLADWGRDRVIFLITHRLSTIRNADQIAFIEDGQIVEKASHEELIAKDDGRYRAFVEAEIVGEAGGADHE